MAEFDVVIQGGTVVDGRRMPRFRGDVAIRDGKVAAIGRVDAARAERVIDADGLVVAPGFVDLHTHYDAQIFWDPYCTISGWHGVTSVAIGNCGFGFAPVVPELRERPFPVSPMGAPIPSSSRVAPTPPSSSPACVRDEEMISLAGGPRPARRRLAAHPQGVGLPGRARERPGHHRERRADRRHPGRRPAAPRRRVERKRCRASRTR